MFSEDGYLGSPCGGVESLRALNDKLNAEVVERVNDTQELVMMSSYAVEADEYQFKKCMQERISELASWRWVLSDLATRLDEAMNTLQHEHKALRVVIERVKSEISGFSKECSKPGALCPLSDNVEDAIRKEYEFLKKQRHRFEQLTPDLDMQISALAKTKKKIQEDILIKEKAMSVEESCVKLDLSSASLVRGRKCAKKKVSLFCQWENRCKSLKNEGLRALTNAVVTRQQLRGARVELSISAQAYAARVDSALRRRLHANQAKLQELSWQRDEAVKDFQSLDVELTNTEKTLLENMEQERLVEARIADRCMRPAGELVKDDVDRKLKDELTRIRRYNKELRANIDRINKLQINVTSAIAQVDCVSEDIMRVIKLDHDRINARLGIIPEETIDQSRTSASTPPGTPNNSQTVIIFNDPQSSTCLCGPATPPPSQESEPHRNPYDKYPTPSTPQTSFESDFTHRQTTSLVMGDPNANYPLNTIIEEDEEDDYPFDD